MVNANNVSAGSDAGVNHQISICVCTCRRPELLVGCLESLATMDLPGGVGVTVSVIDNDQQPSARALVDEMGHGVGGAARGLLGPFLVL